MKRSLEDTQPAGDKAVSYRHLLAPPPCLSQEASVFLVGPVLSQKTSFLPNNGL